jgi:hypothetical protein
MIGASPYNQRTPGRTLRHHYRDHEGQAVAVADECGSSGENLMEITGLAPEGTAKVHLTMSAGAGERRGDANGPAATVEPHIALHGQR